MRERSKIYSMGPIVLNFGNYDFDILQSLSFWQIWSNDPFQILIEFKRKHQTKSAKKDSDSRSCINNQKLRFYPNKDCSNFKENTDLELPGEAKKSQEQIFTAFSPSTVVKTNYLQLENLKQK